MADEPTEMQNSTTEPTPADAAPPAQADAPVEGTLLGGDDAPVDEAPAADPAADDKPAEPEGAPEAYDLKAPEGSTFDADAFKLAEPVLRDLNLSNEAAQKLADVFPSIVEQVSKAGNAQLLASVADQRRAWAEEAKADEEIGGANFKANLETSAAALDKLGFEKGSPFRVLLNDSGLGNHPDMIRAFVRIGKAIGEDSNFVRGDAAAPIETNIARILYPNDKPKGA